jgi:hypothetical protein
LPNLSAAVPLIKNIASSPKSSLTSLKLFLLPPLFQFFRLFSLLHQEFYFSIIYWDTQYNNFFYTQNISRKDERTNVSCFSIKTLPHHHHQSFPTTPSTMLLHAAICYLMARSTYVLLMISVLLSISLSYSIQRPFGWH